MSAEFMLKPFVVSVPGFGEFAYPAASRGRALAEAWQSYTSCYHAATFKDFLRIARVRRGEPSPRFGEPITVASSPAFYVGERGQYIRFVRPGSPQILLSHPLDVNARDSGSDRQAKTPQAAEGEASQSGLSDSEGIAQ